MTFVVKKRCVRCHKVLRADGTCQNPVCVLYRAPKEEKTDEKETEKP